jgi:hypothetical protein
MSAANVTEFLAECLWPGVREADLAALDERARESVARAPGVRYLGSLLICEDEVVLCCFTGQLAAVRAAAQAAQIPFERILETRGNLGWMGSPAAERVGRVMRAITGADPGPSGANVPRRR